LVLRNRIIDLSVVAEVAAALQSIDPEIVFVGGAVVSCYANDVPPDEVRPTADVDLTVNVVSYNDQVKLQEKLAEIGFYPDPEGPSICRHKFNGIPVDIIPIKDSPVGEANSWYEPGLEFAFTIEVKGEKIRILSAPYFLATKFEAFQSRGQDPRTSHDVEDIFFVLDQRKTIVEEVLGADETVKVYISDQFKTLESLIDLEELIVSHLYSDFIDERLPVIRDRILKIIRITSP
jgi:hypothetical protein